MSDAAAGVGSHIQPFNLHDDPGIHTTVLLKGGPQRCAWYRSWPSRPATAPPA
jgi:pyruvate-formate lyase-activating enzyme